MVRLEQQTKGTNPLDTVTITREEYQDLLDDSRMLRALEDAGVDNWSGCDYARELYYDRQED